MPLPDNVRFIGPVLDGPAINKSVGEVPVDDGPRPLVVASFSTSYRAHSGRLQEVVDALRDTALDVVVTTGPAIRPEEISAGSNVRVAGFVAHDRLLPKASVVVTHAGHGTLMAALSHGVPVVCVPMGRDQFFNAALVDRLGVGRAVPPDAGPDDIRREVEDVLTDDDVREEAKRFGSTIARYGGADEALRELEQL